MSGLPPGFAPVGGGLPSGFSPVSTAKSSYNYDEMRALILKHGGSSDAADILAHVARSESDGNPNAKNQYVQDGKTYHVHGLWQISDINGDGNYTDPDTAAAKAVALYREHGLSPWEASRTSGAHGGWGQYLAGAKPTDPLQPAKDFFATLNRPIVAPASAAETVPPGFTPLAQHQGSGAPPPGPHVDRDQSSGNVIGAIDKQSGAGVSGAKAAATASSALGIATDYLSQASPGGAPFGAAVRDLQKRPGGVIHNAIGQYFDFDPKHPDLGPNSEAARKLLSKPTPANVHKAQEQYDINSPAHGDPTAGLIEIEKKTGEAIKKIPGATNPLISPLGYVASKALSSEAADRTVNEVASQLINPFGGVARAAGAMVGDGTRALAPITSKAWVGLEKSKIAGPVARGISAVRESMAPYAGVRRVANATGVDPDKAVYLARSYDAAPSQAGKAAIEQYHSLFKGYSRADAIEAERMREMGLSWAPRIKGADLAKAQELVPKMRQFYLNWTNDQQMLDLLDETHTYDPLKYSNRAGAYDEIDSSPDIVAFKKRFRQVEESASPKTQSKVYDTYDEAEASGKLKKNYDPRDQALSYAMQRGTQVLRERAVHSMRDLGLWQDLAIVDKDGNILGTGNAGDKAATELAQRNTRAKSHDDAFEKVNLSRQRDGLVPYTREEFGELRTILAKQGADRVRAQQTGMAANQLDKLGAASAKGSARTETLAHTELTAEIAQRQQQLEKLNARIEKMRETVHQGDVAARGRSLIAATAQRDKIAEQLDNLAGVQKKQLTRAAPTRALPKLSRSEKDVIGYPYDDKFQKIANRVGPVKRYEYTGPSGKVVGHVEVSYPSGAAPHIEDLETYRGNRKQGIGEAMLRDVRERLRQQGHDSVTASPKDETVERLNTRVFGPMQRKADLDEHAFASAGAPAVDRAAEKLNRATTNAMSSVARAGADKSGARIVKRINETAEQFQKRLDKDATRTAAKTAKIAAPSARVADAVLGAGTKARARQQVLLDKLGRGNSFKYDLAVYRDAFKTEQRGRAGKYKDAIVGRSESDAEAAGLTRTIGTTSPALRHGIASPAVARFFAQRGASTQDAESIGNFIDRMNSLTKIGVITNPVVHGGWNLGTHYLAAGGPMSLLGRDLWRGFEDWGDETYQGQKFTGKQQEELADKFLANQHMASTHPLFDSPSGYSEMFVDKTNLNEMGLPRWMNAQMSRLWAANQRVVFGQLESRYATKLFWKYIKDGTSPERAGVQVRKALGDYTNISKHGVDKWFQQTVFFYPWFKTALPFWAKMLTTRPQFITVPGLGTHRWNESIGDPDADKLSYGAVSLGKNKNGSYREWTPPWPQKYAEDLLELAAPNGDVGASITDRGQEAQKIFDSRLKPFGAIPALASALETQTSRAQDPGQSSARIYANRDADLPTQARQLAGSVAGSLPFGEDLGGIATAAGDAAHGDPRRAVFGAAGGFQYDRDEAVSKKVSAAQYKLDHELAKAHRERFHDPDRAVAIAKRARADFEKDIKKIHDREERKALPSGFAALPPGFTPLTP